MPRLDELPAPPAGREGWPWTEGGPALPTTMPNGRKWPRVTVVTAVYNQRDYIEETIRSVLLQDYPRLEYIIVDDGSTDGSEEIVRRYEAWLYWERQANAGPSAAYNRGFRRARGEVVAWINSDDTFLPGGFEQALAPFRDGDVDWVVGEAVYVDAQGNPTGVQPFRFSEDPGTWFFINTEFLLPQQGSFWKKSVFERIGYMDESTYNCFDYELFFRMLESGYRPVYSGARAATYRFHGTSKSVSQKHRFYAENVKVWEMYRHLCPRATRPRLDAMIRREVLDIETTRCEEAVAAGRRGAGLAGLLRAMTRRPWLIRRRLSWATAAKAMLGKKERTERLA